MTKDDRFVRDFFSDILEEETSKKSYLYFHPGGIHDYYVRKKPKQLRYLSDTIAGQGFKRKMAAGLFRRLSFLPGLLQALPRINGVNLKVGDTTTPDLIITSKVFRLISKEVGVVHTVSPNHPEKVLKEIEARTSLPTEIPTPDLYQVDRSIPYYTEEFIDGRIVGPPTKAWSKYCCVYQHLSSLYKKTVQEPRSTQSTINRVLNDLRDEPVDSSWIEQIEYKLHKHEMPDRLRKCKIHGDLNERNILIRDGNLYLIDWEGYRTGYPMYDLFRPFLIQYYDTRDTSPFHRLLNHSENGPQWGSDVGEIIGPIMYDSKDWFPGLLLLTMVQALTYLTTNSPLWECTHEILDDISQYP